MGLCQVDHINQSIKLSVISEVIVLTMIGISNSNKTSYRNGCQSRTNAYIQLQMECYIGIKIG
jgi:hypothetical protein